MGRIVQSIGELLGSGLEGRELDILQMSVRAAIVYVLTLIMVRIGKRRFMGRATAFDVILGIMLGSIVSRAVTGNAPFLPALASVAVLLGMHWLFAWMALRWSVFGRAIKGSPTVLVERGKRNRAAMRKALITDRDLDEDLRARNVARLEDVAEARLERNGQISVVRAQTEVKVVEMKVVNGVQRIRIKICR